MFKLLSKPVMQRDCQKKKPASAVLRAKAGFYPTALAEFIRRPQAAFQIGAKKSIHRQVKISMENADVSLAVGPCFGR